jgi:hypothetical protein
VFISAYWQTGLRANFSRKYAELAALVVPVAKNPAKNKTNPEVKPRRLPSWN